MSKDQTQSVLDELNAVTDKVYTYLKAGDYTLEVCGYEWKNGTSYTGVVGPAFTFRVVESSNPSLPPGTEVGRLIRLNVETRNPDKRKKAMAARKAEVIDIVRTCLVNKNPDLASTRIAFEDIAADLPKVDKLGASIQGARLTAHCEDVQVGDKTYTNVNFGSVSGS